MALGARIKQRRKELALTQVELAQLVGVAQSLISSLELRDSRKTDHLAEFADVLGVTVHWLSTGLAPKFSKPTHDAPIESKTSSRQRIIIDKVVALSDRSLQQIEPLLDALGRLESLERTQRLTKKKRK